MKPRATQYEGERPITARNLTWALRRQELMSAARPETGRDSFGDDDLREPLAVLCRSLSEEAPLTGEGLEAHRLHLKFLWSSHVGHITPENPMTMPRAILRQPEAAASV
jgi:hypothetical protein